MTDWGRMWRSSGVVAVILLIVASVLYGRQPKLGASPVDLVSFFHGDRTRILIATVFFCFAFLELLWFGAALSSVLRDAGKGGWAAAATASSAAFAAVLFVRMAVRAALAFSIAGSGLPQVTTGFSDLGWVLTVILSFPAAMFVMSGAFGLWRAEIISKRFFVVGVVGVVLVVLGGTTWAKAGFWALTVRMHTSRRPSPSSGSQDSAGSLPCVTRLRRHPSRPLFPPHSSGSERGLSRHALFRLRGSACLG